MYRLKSELSLLDSSASHPGSTIKPWSFNQFDAAFPNNSTGSEGGWFCCTPDVLLTKTKTVIFRTMKLVRNAVTIVNGEWTIATGRSIHRSGTRSPLPMAPQVYVPNQHQEPAVQCTSIQSIATPQPVDRVVEWKDQRIVTVTSTIMISESFVNEGVVNFVGSESMKQYTRTNKNENDIFNNLLILFRIIWSLLLESTIKRVA